MRNDLLDLVATSDTWPSSRLLDDELIDALERRREDRVSVHRTRPRIGYVVAAMTLVALAGIAIWGLARAEPSSPVAPLPGRTLPSEPAPTTSSVATTTAVNRPGGVSVAWTPLEVPFAADVDPLLGAGDRFVVVELGARRVWSSEDGRAWVQDAYPDEIHGFRTFAAWGDRIIGWEGGGQFGDGSGTFMIPGRIVVAVPGGPAVERTFEGGSVTSAAVGPRGIVVVLDAIDEFGADDEPRFTGWVSSDGDDWAMVDEFPEAWRVVAVETGFFALGESGAWYSPDGLNWAEVGVAGRGYGRVEVDRDVLVVMDETGVFVVRDDGVVSAEAPMRSWSQLTLLGAGAGRVTVVDLIRNSSFSSEDGGSTWSSGSLPPAMAEADDWGMWTPEAVQVGAVIIARVYGLGEDFTARWFLGVPGA